jgi:hypothetical protein
MNGVVTHHVKSSLIPAETGLSYAQNATLEGGRLIFTVRNRTHGKETVRRKVWERIAGNRAQPDEEGANYSVIWTSVRPCPPACAPCIRLTSERRALG